MAITHEDIKRAVGRKHDPSATYTLQTLQGAHAKVAAKTHKMAGVIPTTGDGDMVILEELSSVKQSLISKLRGAF
jgi:hypothetical protein